MSNVGEVPCNKCLGEEFPFSEAERNTTLGDEDIDIEDIKLFLSESEGEKEIQEEKDLDSDIFYDINDWNEDLKPIPIESFSGPEPGPTRSLGPEKTEMDFLHLFFKEELYEVIACAINAYAQKQLKTCPDKNWLPTDPGEIKAFLGIRIVMGILPAPSTGMYWFKDKLFHPSCLETKMGRVRYETLLKYFRVTDTPIKLEKENDELTHLRPIIESIRSSCISQYNPHKEVSIGEAMLTSSGLTSVNQDFSRKQFKNIIKFWIRADPHNGYICDFRIDSYNERKYTDEDILDLMNPLLNLGHHVYTDSSITSPQLFLKLWEYKTYGCGPIELNRSRLKLCFNKRRLKEKGSIFVRQKGNLRVTHCGNNRNKIILFNNCNEMDTIDRKKEEEDNSNIDTSCPFLIKLLNKYSNGVDYAAQLRSIYNISGRLNNLWKILFFSLFDISVVNAFVLMMESSNHQYRTKVHKTRNSTLMDFRMKLAHQLLESHSKKRKRKLSSEFQLPPHSVHHWPTVMDKKKTCKMCSQNKIRSEPITGCEQCKINLCIKCFKSYHRKMFPSLFN